MSATPTHRPAHCSRNSVALLPLQLTPHRSAHRSDATLHEGSAAAQQHPSSHRLPPYLLTVYISAARPAGHVTRRHTENEDEQRLLAESVDKLEDSLKTLNAKMNWLKNYERIQTIQQQLVWKSVREIEPRNYVPEFMRPALSHQPCERLLGSPRRQLLHEGPVTLLEGLLDGPVTLLEISKAVDMFIFLFDDILVLTRVKKSPRKPIALDRFTVHDVTPPESLGTLELCLSPHVAKCSFVLVHITRFQQIIGVYTLQATSEAAKATWMRCLTDAQDAFHRVTHPTPTPEANSKSCPCCQPSASRSAASAAAADCAASTLSLSPARRVHCDPDKCCCCCAAAARITRRPSTQHQQPIAAQLQLQSTGAVQLLQPVVVNSCGSTVAAATDNSLQLTSVTDV